MATDGIFDIAAYILSIVVTTNSIRKAFINNAGVTAETIVSATTATATDTATATART